MTTDDRDLIRMAISPAQRVAAPLDLGDDIYRAILATPQRRPGPRFLSSGWAPVPAGSLVFLVLLALLACAVVVAILARPSPLPRPITMYHGDAARTGVMPGPGPLGDPVVQWTAELDGAVPFTVMPVVADERVFVPADSGSVVALTEADGLTVWTASVGWPIRSSPVLWDDLLIVGSDGGEVTALRVADGEQVWQLAVGGVVSASLLIADATLYVGSEEGLLLAVDPTTGRERWTLELDGPVTRGPAFADGILYVGTEGGHFSAVDVAGRAAIWTVELGAGEVGTPAVAGDLVYLGRGIEAASSTHDLVALDRATGRKVWSFAAPSGLQVHAGAIGERFVYGVSEDGNVYALDRATGTLAWTHATEGDIGSLASIVDETLYVASTAGTVRAIDVTDGTLRWVISVVGAPTLPVVVNGRVIVGTTLGKVVAIGGRR